MNPPPPPAANRATAVSGGTIHELVTAKMIAALERGTIPWHKPWHAHTGQPRSMTTGQPYRGINIFLLGLAAADDGYTSPYWGTYRQISQLGGQVRRGQHSTLVVFYKQHQIADPTSEADRREEPGEVRTVPVLRYYRVFNAGQADDLPPRFYPEPGTFTQITEPQAALDGYLRHGGPQLRHAAGDRASYHGPTDTIQLPQREQFATPESYYATAFHECGHSTGHQSRLARPGIVDFDHFGSGRYAKEELTAQMTSAILCAQTGIDTPEQFAHSASYIASWLSALHDDTKLVVTAAAHAQRAADLVIQPSRQAEPAPDPRPDQQTTPHTAPPAAAASHRPAHLTDPEAEPG
jgi:antirestriction protein ArdC